MLNAFIALSKTFLSPSYDSTVYDGGFLYNVVILQGRWCLVSMVYTVYIDVVLLANTLMDLAVLLIVRRAEGHSLSGKKERLRLLAAALIGGFWACILALDPGIPGWLQGIITYIGISILMAGAAFGFKSVRGTLRDVAWIYLVSLVLSGIMVTVREQAERGTYFGSLSSSQGWEELHLVAWLFCAAGAAAGGYGLLGLFLQYVKKTAGRNDLRQVTLRCRGKAECVTGLIDTGNRLTEPVSGKPVHVAERELMERLCPEPEGVIYIPYQSVGGSGLLLAVFIDEIRVEGKGECYLLERPLVAVSNRPLCTSSEYQILIQKTDQGIQLTGGHSHDD